jgi:mono/diheme cytochrome c family protein
MKRLIILGALIAIPAVAQQDTKIENPFRGVMQDRSSRSADERLFVEKCSMCHRQMGMGSVILARRMDPKIARLEMRTDLTAEFITAASRQGIGNMPRISRGEVSDAQLARIAAYLSKRDSGVPQKAGMRRAGRRISLPTSPIR